MAGQAARSQAHDSTFRITPVRPVAELQQEALRAQPPVEPGNFRVPDLVDLAKLDSTMRFDIRYATERNFMGTVFYKSARAFLQQPVAVALLGASAELFEEGKGMIVFDAYRPWFVTKMFWEGTPDSLKHFVAPPQTGSRHNRGSAVDLGLYDLHSGEILPMPSGYDEFTKRAYVDFSGGSKEARNNRDLLRAVMEHHGFTVYPYEWWHFDHVDSLKYPIMNVRFEEID